MKQITVRLDDKISDKITEMALKNKRSVSNEIALIIEKQLKTKK